MGSNAVRCNDKKKLYQNCSCYVRFNLMLLECWSENVDVVSTQSSLDSNEKGRC